MEVDLIFKIAAIGILVAVLNQLLVRSGRDEQAMMTTLTGLLKSINFRNRPGVKFCVSDFRQSQEWRWKAGRILG